MENASTFEPSIKLPLRPYRADGGYEITGLTISLVGGMVAAAVAGFLAHLISQWVYLILIFPVAIGFGVGFVGARAAKWFRVRSPWAAGLAGLLAGVSAMLCMHYFDYQASRSQVAELSPEVQALYQLPPDQFKEFVNNNVEAKEQESANAEYALYHAESLSAYMDAQARQGVELKRVGGSDSGGMNLGYVGSFIYWIVEVLMVALVSAGVMKVQAAEPYCRRCGAWKRQQKLGTMGTDPAAALAAVNSGDTALIRACARSGPGPTELITYSCPTCPQSCEVDAKLQVIIPPKKKKEKPTLKTIAFVTYGQGSLGPLAEAFRDIPPAPLASK